MPRTASTYVFCRAELNTDATVDLMSGFFAFLQTGREQSLFHEAFHPLLPTPSKTIADH